MVVKEIINIGEKIEVVVQDHSNLDGKTYFSMVQDVPQEDEIVITMPMLKGEPVVLSLGQRVRINFFRDRGQFYFYADVIDRQRNDAVYLIRLKQASPVHRLQRRNFYRLKISLPVFFRIVEQGFQQNDIDYRKAYTVDISGGGVRILTDEELKPGQQVECQIPIGEGDKLELKGLVVRTTPCLDGRYKYDLGIKFMEILEAERDRLIRFIFEQQRRLKSKDLM